MNLKTDKNYHIKIKREYDSLPNELEELENKMQELNSCLADPKCYEKLEL